MQIYMMPSMVPRSSAVAIDQPRPLLVPFNRLAAGNRTGIVIEWNLPSPLPSGRPRTQSGVLSS